MNCTCGIAGPSTLFFSPHATFCHYAVLTSTIQLKFVSLLPPDTQRKSLRDQWLMEGAPLSPLSPDLQSPLSGTKPQEMEKCIDRYSCLHCVYLTFSLVKLLSWLADTQPDSDKFSCFGTGIYLTSRQRHTINRQARWSYRQW